ncbi:MULTISPECIES: DNA-3-methyladenine glycosylase 2 family protein [unclassified Salinibacterium]|uniref:DNA-3-methyladenine glycosylase family protein n=1 Tax=unclassified Salinibacterium TaxID=2632331 RepID=UPI0014221540|nr:MULTISPECIES: DNA-3-methyladenine glycosylase 2 family protein [unclassified Salinibacterium]
MDPITTRYAPAAPVSLRLVIGHLAQGRGDPTVQRTPEGWWLTMRLATGAATLLLRERPDSIEATAWGDGAAEAIDGVPRLLGAHDDLDGFDASRHPLIARLHHETPGLRLGGTGRVLPALVPSVLGQKVTAMEAKRAWRILVSRHGDPAPGPAPLGMRVLPTPDTWKRIPSWEWHTAAVGPQRSDTLMRVFAVGSAIARCDRLDSAESARRLASIHGIGRWTVAETLQRSHGDPDAVSYGDLHICKRVGTALIGERVDDDGMMELLEPWRGHRQRVVRLITIAGIDYQRHAPRLTIPDHRAR